MPSVRIAAFGGMQPVVSERLLPDNGALRAENVKLQSGELRPLNRPRIVYAPNKPMPPKSIYRARNGLISAGWLTWPFDVDVVRAPLPVEVESRYYWTGDGEPRMAEHTEAISGANDDYPHLCFALGIPKPQDKPEVIASGGSGSMATRFYCCTFFSEKGEESAPSPISESIDGKLDGVFELSNLPEFPVNEGELSGTCENGYTTFECVTYHWLREYDPVLLDGKSVSVAKVIDKTSFRVVGDYSDVNSWSRAVPWNTGLKRRLYRTTGTSGTFLLVAEDVGTSYTDTLSDADILGDELISEGWEPPDPRLRGICVHASGALAGFFGNQLCFSEPLQPHTWPKSYRLSTDYPIVGIAPFGSEVGVATEGNPYVASGVEPGSMTMQKVEGLFPCVSKRSVIAVGDGAIYASNHGLIYIGAAGVRVFTESFYSRDEWLLKNPSSMVCDYTSGKVYCAYQTALGESEILVFDGAVHVVIGIAVSDLYADQSTGELYLGMADGIYLFDPKEQSYPMQAAWRSKEFTFPSPCNLGAAKIDFKLAIDPAALQQLIQEREYLSEKNRELLQAGGFFGAMNFAGYNEKAVNGSRAYFVPPLPPTNDIQFVLRSNGKIIFQRVINNTKAFRLPAGIKYDHASVEVSGQGAVYDIRLAETMEGLKLV